MPTTPITRATPYVRVKYSIELRGGLALDDDGYYDGFKARILNTGSRGWWNDSGTKTRGPIVQVVHDTLENVGDVLLDYAGRPMNYLNGYMIGTGPGSATAVASPVDLPATTTLELTKDVNQQPIAYFLKLFPRGMKLADLNVLGL